MRLVLALNGGAIEITSPRTPGPYQWLLDVGTLRTAARAGDQTGIGVGESPSVVVSIDNTKRKAAAKIGRPLRERATVYDDDGAEFFAGTVSVVALGRVITLTLEA